MGISIIIPVQDNVDGLCKTLGSIHVALQAIKIQNVEIIIVDDGSIPPITTNDIIHNDNSLNIKIISQKNQGRFHARLQGLKSASCEHVLFVDSRVLIGAGSIRFISEQHVNHPSRTIWNGHVEIADTSTYGYLMDSLTKTVWRKYFKKPRLVSYNINDFDSYPKGTTLFFAPRDILIKAHEVVSRCHNMDGASSDDIKMIREIAKNNAIWISPEFNCLYTPRKMSLGMFGHMYHRGAVFYDGYKKTSGFFGTLLKLSIFGVVILPFSLFFSPHYLAYLVILLCIVMLINAKVHNLGRKHILSQCLLLVPFTALFICGIFGSFLSHTLSNSQKMFHKDV